MLKERRSDGDIRLDRDCGPIDDRIEVRSPRLRAIVSVISAFAVFVHAAVGCCAHHGHVDFGATGCQGRHRSFEGMEFADDEHAHLEADCGDPDSAAKHGQEGEEHGPSQGACEGARCLGIRVAKTVDLDAVSGVWAKFASGPQGELNGRDAVHASWQMGHSYAPPVRRHLAHCVLLI